MRHGQEPEGLFQKTVKKAWIEDLVIKSIKDMLFTDGMIHYLTDMVMDLQSRENLSIPAISQQLAEAEKGIENMLNAIQQGVFTSSTKQRLEALEDTKAKLEVNLLQKELQRPLLTREQVMFWLHKYRDMDMSNSEQRQQLVDSFINAIYLYDDKMVITFNYKDSTKTITIAEAESPDLGTLEPPRICQAHARIFFSVGDILFVPRISRFFCFFNVLRPFATLSARIPPLARSLPMLLRLVAIPNVFFRRKYRREFCLILHFILLLHLFLVLLTGKSS